LVVEIHLHTILQRITDTGTIRKMNIELPPGSSLAEVLGTLEIDLPVDGLLLIVNGKNADLKCLLEDGDIIHIIPALSGG
jgi:molybdopterin converting factor small subunit